jgi:hypothetical protein
MRTRVLERTTPAVRWNSRSDAQVYPQCLYCAIVKGIALLMKVDSAIKDACFGLQVPDNDAQACAFCALLRDAIVCVCVCVFLCECVHMALLAAYSL